MSSKTTKRSRSKNFTDDECLKLLEIVVLEKHILENKHTNAITNSEKIQAWKRISTLMNSQNPMNFRTPEQFANKYDNLKNRAKKYAASNKMLLYGTGGGPNKMESDVILDKVLELINVKGVNGDISICDDDYDVENCDTNKFEFSFAIDSEQEKENLSPEMYTLDYGPSTSKKQCSSLPLLELTELTTPKKVIREPEPYQASTSSKKSAGNKTAKYSHNKKKQSVDLEAIVTEKANYYKEKLKNLELEMEYKKLQIDTLKNQLYEKKEKLPIELALLKEELKGKIMANKLLEKQLQ